MTLEKHERKLVLALHQDDAIHHRHSTVPIWMFVIVGVLSIVSQSMDNPHALDDFFAGVGPVFLMAAAGMWLDLRHRRLIQKLAKRLDALDPTWTIPDE